MKFVIPLQRDELLTPKEPGVYRVEDVFPIRELQSKLKDCEVAFQRQGCGFIQTGAFDVLYSVLTHFHKDLSGSFKSKTFDILHKALQDLVQKLDYLLDQGNVMDSEEKAERLSQMKMILYLFCQFVELQEANDTSSADLFVGKSNKKARIG